MKPIRFVIALCLMAMNMMAQPVNIITFNLRYSNEGDSANAWKYRKDFAAQQILFHEADIVGVQEALYSQVQDLQQRLPAFTWHGVGRDDGATEGEFSAIFYNKKRFKKLAGSTFWLSETPTVAGSKSWDAAITRIVTWIKLEELAGGKTFFVFNTHFDHMGQEARRRSAHILLQAVDSLAGKTPAIITGDFNATPEEEPIRIITNTADKLHLTDTKSLSKSPHFGPAGTFNDFKQKETSELPIDHIFIRGNFEVLKHATLAESIDGRFSSDHFPVFCRLVIL